MIKATDATTTTTTTSSSNTPSLSVDTEDNNDIMMIKERIENATEGLPSSNCFNYLSKRYCLHQEVKRTL
jgi:hypothetical protein